MRKMLNTLYIMTEDAYATLNGENVQICYADGNKKSIPLHTLESIVMFSYRGASPALMGKCEQSGITLTFFSPYGRYYATVGSGTRGNIFLRREQYRISDDSIQSLPYARNFIIGKLYNSRHQLSRCIRDHAMQVDTEIIQKSVSSIDEALSQLSSVESIESLRGVEGAAATNYFSSFDELILQRKELFYFKERNRRPPTDALNALMSFAYSLLANDCAAALMSVGLDPYAGFLHVDRPGRKSLALDLMEELRSVVADRTVLFMINNRVFDADDFLIQESGAVLLTDNARKKFLTKWQAKKREELQHPFLKEKITWGLVPYAQAVLLARCIRGDLDEYPPFFWR